MKKPLFAVSALCLSFVVSAAPGSSPAGRRFTLEDHIEKSTPIVKRFRNRNTGMTVRLSTVFWNDSIEENDAAYRDFTFFEVMLRNQGFVKDGRSACELVETDRSSPAHCSIENFVYREEDRRVVIVVECNGRAGRQFPVDRPTARSDAKNFFESERQAIMRPYGW